MERLLFSRRESAAILNISVRELDYRIARGELAIRRVGRRVLIPGVELEKFASNHEPPKKAATDGNENSGRSLA
jgi:hypothetical protein